MNCLLLKLCANFLQTLNTALENVPKDRNGKMSKEHLRVAIDSVAAGAGLPPIGAVDEVLKQQPQKLFN